MGDRTDAAEPLRLLVDLVVPADEFLSGSEAGGLDFLAGYLTERSDLRDRGVGLIPRWGPGAKHRWPASAADRAPVSTRRAPAG